MTINLRKALLAGSAIVAVGALAAAPVRAADVELAGTAGAPTDATGVATDDINNLVDSNANAGSANVDNGIAPATITSDFNGSLAIYDGTNDTAAGDTLTVGTADIASGTTFTVYFGGTLADGSGTDGAEEGNLTITGAVNGGSTSTRGGTLALTGVANEATGPGTVTLEGNVLMTGLSFTGGAGGGTEAGSAVTGVVGNASSDTLNVTTLTVTGGAGDAAGARNGGNAAVTVTSASTIGGNTTVTGGTDGAGGGNGGSASLIFVNGVTGTGSLTVTGGTTGGAGTAGDATVLSRGATTFSAITLDSAEGIARLTFDVATDDTGDFSVSGAINGAAASEGVLLISDDSAVTADTVTFLNAIGGTAAATALNTINVGDGTGNEGGHAIFNSTVRATTINVGAANTGDEASTADFAGAITATDFKVTAGNAAAEDATATVRSDLTAAVTLTDSAATADATLTFDSATSGGDITVVGAIVGGNAGDGIINVGDGTSATDVTFNGAIGGTAIEAFNVKTSSSATIDVAAATTVKVTSGAATDAGVNVDGTLTLDAADGTVAISDTVGDIDLDGTVAITGDNAVTFTADSDVFIDGTTALETELTAAKTTTVTATNGDISLGLTGDTVLALGNQLVLASGDDILVSDATDAQVTFAIRYTSAFDADATTVIDATGNAGSTQIDTSGTNAAVVVAIDADSAEFDDGDTVTVFDTNDLEDEANTDTTWTALIASGDVELRDTALVDIQDNASTDDLLVKMVFNEANDVVTSSAAGAAQALMDMASADTTAELADARGNLLAAASDAAAQEVAESLGPDVAGGANLATQLFTTGVESITSNRLAMVRDGSAPATGMSAGEMAGGSSWWVQGFGTMANQDERDGVDGYDADVLGVAVGADSENVIDGATVGAALAYANVGVDSDNANETETDIDAFQIALYGDYDLDSRTYVAGQVGYTWGNNDTTRSNVGGIAGLTANGDYDSSQFNVRGEVGRDYMSGETKLTPKLVADYTWYSADDYTETGAGTANLNVDADSQNILNLGVGLDAGWMVKHSDGSYLEPAVHALARYDVIGDEIETTNTFTGGGASFVTQGADPARASLDLGADVTFHTTQNWDLKAGYNFEVKQDFTAHSGQLKAAYKF